MTALTLPVASVLSLAVLLAACWLFCCCFATIMGCCTSMGGFLVLAFWVFIPYLLALCLHLEAGGYLLVGFLFFVRCSYITHVIRTYYPNVVLFILAIFTVLMIFL